MFEEEQSKDEVLLPMFRYDQLIKAEKTLDALEAAGVNNWDGYSEAFEFMDDE